MKVSVFVPSHITCFFSIHNDPNPLKKGSCGTGILIDKGVKTIVKPLNRNEIAIKINGKLDYKNDIISKKTANYMKNKYNINEGIAINHEIDVPIGSGFGTSASSALGIAIAINKVFDLRIKPIKLYQIAHKIEVESGSGLGDVIAEISKGIVVRTKPGAPNFGKTKNIHFDDLYIVTKTLGEIDTLSIISNSIITKKINEIGIFNQKTFLKNITIKNLLDCSYNFAVNTGLANNDLIELINDLKKSTLGSSMAMLGNTAFALTNDSSFNDIDDVLVSKIYNDGIKVN
jgi:pantoate kinase